MHELSLAYSVVELVEQEISLRGGGRLRGLEIAIGDFSGVDKEAFLFALDMVLAALPFTGVELNVEQVAALAQCNQCGDVFSPDTFYSSCPRCGSFASRLISGQDFKVIALTVETLHQEN